MISSNETTVATFQEAKQNQKKLTMLTAYDYSTAKLFDEAGIDSLLVGDSLGMVMLGYEDTLSVTMEDMLHHCKAVARGAKQAMVICDLPFLSYQTSVYDAVKNAAVSSRKDVPRPSSWRAGQTCARRSARLCRLPSRSWDIWGLPPSRSMRLGGSAYRAKQRTPPRS